MNTTNKKILDYYKMKTDIELLDKFINDYFISLERKDGKLEANIVCNYGNLLENGNPVLFKDRKDVKCYMDKAFDSMKFELLSKTLELMRADFVSFKRELINECKEFLKNEADNE